MLFLFILRIEHYRTSNIITKTPTITDMSVKPGGGGGVRLFTDMSVKPGGGGGVLGCLRTCP